MKKYYAVLSLFLLLFVAGCFSSKSIYYGKVLEKKYEVGNFDSVNFSGPAELIITEGKTPSLIVRTYGKFQQYVNVNNSDNKLFISFCKNLTGYETSSLRPV
ncbi:MAG: hypothetical protein GY756_03840, partial [bacterium]|nr:hypothetical protein [bacterium]